MSDESTASDRFESIRAVGEFEIVLVPACLMRHETTRRAATVVGAIASHATTMRTLQRHKWSGRTGLTLIEIMLTTVIMVIAVGGLSSSVLSSLRLGRVNDESARAHAAARQMAEIIQDVDFADIFAMFNDDDSDDPVADAPGASFDIDGLTPLINDEDGAVGTILFPTADTGGGLALREDIVDADLGMPRDLNGDGVIDSSNHAADYLVLPVTIRVQWRGAAGNRQMDLDLILVE